ncbi:MAG: hypothetical protein LBF74_07845 [Treponema sp.]|jgi:hypothetical protein|nr:hypothetical protein [Treponema sp.]
MELTAGNKARYRKRRIEMTGNVRLTGMSLNRREYPPCGAVSPVMRQA